jgi:uncharacterized protein
MTRDDAERRTILRALVGSTVHGLNVRDAVEDRDEMGVLVEPFEAVVGFTPLGEELRALAPSIASRRAGHAFLGYLQSQKQRLLGARGQMRVRRPELVARDGYDSKYAMHLCRLGYQGLEFVRTGRLTLPMPEQSREWLYRLRQGEIPMPEMLARAEDIEAALAAAIETSPLPEEPDEPAVEAWMRQTYRRVWAEEADGG